MGYGVLLTGATGAIGPMLAAELLAGGAAEQLRILLRPSLKGEDRFPAYGELVAAQVQAAGVRFLSNRLSATAADLGLDDLGLSASQADDLARDTEIIIHAAADTGFRSPPLEQWNTNVDGVTRMLRLAERCPRLRKFILVSTVCVSGTMTGTISESLPGEPPNFVNHYERTKFAAERVAAESSLPVEIMRLSIVSGSHATGTVNRLGALHHVLKWFGRGLIPRVPGTPDTCVDLIATETAAAFLARAVIVPPRPGLICHVAAGKHAVRLDELMDFTWRQARGAGPLAAEAAESRPRLVDGAEFRTFCDSLDPSRQRILQQAMESVETCLPILLYPRVYDTTHAEALWGGPLPLYDWRQTLAKVLRASHPQPRAASRGVDAA